MIPQMENNLWSDAPFISRRKKFRPVFGKHRQKRKSEYSAGNDFADSDGQHKVRNSARQIVHIGQYQRNNDHIGNDWRNRGKPFAFA